jgi:glyoxylase-like metal-dependent hydrolase (beta-lactamase superfamily II)
MNSGHIFFQLFDSESSTYTYLIADSHSREAALIDPVLEHTERDLRLIDELGLKLKYILDTHVHADHITGAGEIRNKTGAKTGLSKSAQVECVDIPLTDGQELFLGDKKIQVLATPGHTDSCMSFYFEDKVFTGDALLIRGTGRTDFQQGSAEKLYDSVHSKIFTLPDNTLVYPSHDYKGQTSSTIALEKKFNARLGGAQTKADFIKTMSQLKLADPKKMHEALPANLACGKVR